MTAPLREAAAPFLPGLFSVWKARPSPALSPVCESRNAPSTAWPTTVLCVAQGTRPPLRPPTSVPSSRCRLRALAARRRRPPGGAAPSLASRALHLLPPLCPPCLLGYGAKGDPETCGSLPIFFVSGRCPCPACAPPHVPHTPARGPSRPRLCHSRPRPALAPRAPPPSSPPRARRPPISVRSLAAASTNNPGACRVRPLRRARHGRGGPPRL
jgi:hypothetical protein